MKAEFLRGLRERDRVLEIVRQFSRIIENAEANPVVAVRFQDFETRLRLAVVLEDFAAIFRRFQERDVGTDGVIRSLRESSRREERGEQQREKRWRHSPQHPNATQVSLIS